MKCRKQQRPLERYDNSNKFIQKHGKKIIFLVLWLKTDVECRDASSKTQMVLTLKLHWDRVWWVEMSLYLSQNQVDSAFWEKLYPITCKWPHSYMEFTNLIRKEERNNELELTANKLKCTKTRE